MGSKHSRHKHHDKHTDKSTTDNTPQTDKQRKYKRRVKSLFRRDKVMKQELIDSVNNLIEKLHSETLDTEETGEEERGGSERSSVSDVAIFVLEDVEVASLCGHSEQEEEEEEGDEEDVESITSCNNENKLPTPVTPKSLQ